MNETRRQCVGIVEHCSTKSVDKEAPPDVKARFE